MRQYDEEIFGAKEMFHHPFIPLDSIFPLVDRNILVLLELFTLK
jgi:hypothetical protein